MKNINTLKEYWHEKTDNKHNLTFIVGNLENDVSILSACHSNLYSVYNNDNERLRLCIKYIAFITF